MSFLDDANLKINNFIQFVGGKLKNYPALSLGEKIAYPSVGVGVLLLLISVVLFIFWKNTRFEFNVSDYTKNNDVDADEGGVAPSGKPE